MRECLCSMLISAGLGCGALGEYPGLEIQVPSELGTATAEVHGNTPLAVGELHALMAADFGVGSVSTRSERYIATAITFQSYDIHGGSAESALFPFEAVNFLTNYGVTFE